MRLFDWFRSRPRQDEPEREWWERTRQLEHDMRQLQLEWEDTFGKVRRALAALAKRQQREEGGEPREPAADGEARGVAPPDPSAYAQLRAMYGRR